jgi:ribosomal protein RSM22 (predicted rRNA methylase)
VIAPALDPRWLSLIDDVARRVLGPFDRTGAPLVHEIRQLSERYTRRGGALRDAAVERAARMRFFLPRDLPKIGGPLAELADAGALPKRSVWRVLDLGAGLGTTSLGISAFARGLPEPPSGLDVLAVEREAALLDGMKGLCSALSRHPELGVPITVCSTSLDLENDALPEGPFDLVVMGLSLNELWQDEPDAIDRRAALLRSLSLRLSDDGALIVLEPGLASTTRELMQVRDRLASSELIFAPCPARTESCPLLERERDWCHEDLPLKLPPALAALAKEASLRFEGLSYSYLTLRAGAPLTDACGANARVVGGPIRSKGRSELHVCTGGRNRRLNVLDREASTLDTERVGRGALLRLEVLDEREVLRWGRDARGQVVRTVGRPRAL